MKSTFNTATKKESDLDGGASAISRTGPGAAPQTGGGSGGVTRQDVSPISI